MHSVKLLQTVMLLLLVAMAASCAVTKDYSARIFPLRNELAIKKDTATMALRFLDLDTAESEKANWVSTDPILGRDTSSGAATLDNFSRSFPIVKKDSVTVTVDGELNKKTVPIIVADTKPNLKKDEPVARSYDRSPVRIKRSREIP